MNPTRGNAAEGEGSAFSLDDLANVRNARRPVLVTGMPRSATSWVGKVLEKSGQFVYINEPLNPEHPPGLSPGVLRAPVHHRFQYISNETEAEYLQAFNDTLGYRFHLVAELRTNHAPYDLLRAAKYQIAFLLGRMLGKRPLLDDPFAVFSCDWFVRRLACRAVVVARHPAAIVSSRKRLGNRFDFGHLLRQPALMRDWLEPFRDELERAVESDDLIVEGSLLWRLIYGVVADSMEHRAQIELVRHEDLSFDPVAGFRRLYLLLGIPFGAKAERAVLRSTLGRDRGKAHTWSLGGGLSRTGFRRMDSRRHVWKWKEELSAEEIDKVRAITANVADRLYPSPEWW